jgi:hypothetical protein
MEIQAIHVSAEVGRSGPVVVACIEIDHVNPIGECWCFGAEAWEHEPLRSEAGYLLSSEAIHPVPEITPSRWRVGERWIRTGAEAPVVVAWRCTRIPTMVLGPLVRFPSRVSVHAKLHFPAKNFGIASDETVTLSVARGKWFSQ